MVVAAEEPSDPATEQREEREEPLHLGRDAVVAVLGEVAVVGAVPQEQTLVPDRGCGLESVEPRHRRRGPRDGEEDSRRDPGCERVQVRAGSDAVERTFHGGHGVSRRGSWPPACRGSPRARPQPLERDPPPAEHRGSAGDAERQCDVLLDQEDSTTRVGGQSAGDIEQRGHHERCEAEAHLVDQEHAGPTHDGATDRHHLLFASRQQAHAPRQQPFEGREPVQDTRHCVDLVSAPSGPPGVGEAEVVAHRQRRKQAAVLGDVRHTGTGDPVRRRQRQRLAVSDGARRGPNQPVMAPSAVDLPAPLARAGTRPRRPP